MKTYSILMVCMGNICRSPTAEGVLRSKLISSGLGERVHVDSAGTHAWHAGAPPDDRSQAHARRRGYELSALRARPVCAADFERHNLLLAMDWDNLSLLEAQCPSEHQRKLKRLMEFAPGSAGEVVPDPYGGDQRDFERVLDLVELACNGLVSRLSKSLTRQ